MCGKLCRFIDERASSQESTKNDEHPIEDYCVAAVCENVESSGVPNWEIVDNFNQIANITACYMSLSEVDLQPHRTELLTHQLCKFCSLYSQELHCAEVADNRTLDIQGS